MILKLSNKQIKRIAKQIKGQTPTLEELDETFEQDEAHAEFMKGEEREEKILQIVDEAIANGEYDPSIRDALVMLFNSSKTQ